MVSPVYGPSLSLMDGHPCLVTIATRLCEHWSLSIGLVPKTDLGQLCSALGTDGAILKADWGLTDSCQAFSTSQAKLTGPTSKPEQHLSVLASGKKRSAHDGQCVCLSHDSCSKHNIPNASHLPDSHRSYIHMRTENVQRPRLRQVRNLWRFWHDRTSLI